MPSRAFDEDTAAVKADPRGGIFTMTREEIAKLKIVYLAELAASNADRDAAARLVGLTIREVRMIEEEDPDFKQKCQHILEADDIALANAARGVLHSFVKDGSERAKLTAALYLDKTRGGYGQTSRVEHEVRTNSEDVSPVNLADYAQRAKKVVQPVEPAGAMAHDVEWQ